MYVYKCKICGGSLTVIDEKSSVATCDYCGSIQTFSKTNDDIVKNMFNRANHLRMSCEFDKALDVYENILQLDDLDSEAHFGAVLCKYGIEYVNDSKTGKIVPTCHRVQYESILTDHDYIAAIENADFEQAKIYTKQALEISNVQGEILNVVKNETPFDVFISYKEQDNGIRTQDSVLANDIYYELTEAGYKVFYSAVTLEDKLGQDYEPYIFSALNSAKVMLVIGTKVEYFNSVWVKNEWSRYMKLMRNDKKKVLIPCYRDISPYDLPEEFAHLQALDMSKIGFINDVVRGINRLLVSDNPKNLTETNITSSTNMDAILERAELCLENGEFERVDTFCEQVLNQNPKSATAYLYKLMSEVRVKSISDLKNLKVSFENLSSYKNAERFADENLKCQLHEAIDSINKTIRENNNKVVYDEAMRKMSENTLESYQAAIGLFESLHGWNDSENCVVTCKNNILDLKNKEEELRIKKERILAVKKEKRQRKIKLICKTLTILLVSTLVVGVILFVSIKVILPNMKYKSAINDIEKGNFEDAYTALMELGNYKDSKEQLYKLSNSHPEILQVGNSIFFGKYYQKNSIEKDRIEWIILEKDNDKALVLSKYCLDSQPFSTIITDDNWEKSSLRKWLNGDFYDCAFSEENEKNSVILSVESEALNDKIFLLSEDEVYKYLPIDSDRVGFVTSYATMKGAQSKDNGSCWWWLRDSAGPSLHTKVVSFDGKVSNYGLFVTDDDNAVRPAMWVDLKSVSKTS